VSLDQLYHQCRYILLKTSRAMKTSGGGSCVRGRQSESFCNSRLKHSPKRVSAVPMAHRKRRTAKRGIRNCIRPQPPDKRYKGNGPPWQYAMLLGKGDTGAYEPLIKDQSWSTTTPWSMVLRGLLDTTAAAIDERYGKAALRALSAVLECGRRPA